jgi:hypothetical protein
MASSFERKPPIWYWIVAGLLLFWGLGGVYACYMQFTMGADAMGEPTAYDRELYATLPAWYNWVYAVAVGTGALGAAALLARKAIAKPLYVVSAIAIVVQFGWLFATTDIIARKGMATAVFPLWILILALFAIWLSDRAIKRGWIS